MPVGGIRPKSVCQIYGPGHVGTGSLRGMPELLNLREAGFAIWPFDPPGSHTVVEIYPRLLTKEVHKNNQNDRNTYLRAEQFRAFDVSWHTKASSCEDAFDAAISAVCMRNHLDELQSLPATTRQEQLEGKIWTPNEPVQTRDVLDNRYDELKSGRVKPIDGEEAFARLKAKTEAQRNRPG